MLLILWIKMIPFINISLGFRKSHSTQRAIITLLDKITSSLDSEDLLIGVFLDLFKKWHCKPSHTIFKNFSVMAGCTLKWFESYLTDRLQFFFYL